MVHLLVHSVSSSPFLVSVPASTSLAVLLPDLVILSNTRVHLSQLAIGLTELAQYGPVRPSQEYGQEYDQKIRTSASKKDKNNAGTRVEWIGGVEDGGNEEETKEVEEEVEWEEDPMGRRSCVPPKGKYKKLLKEMVRELERAVALMSAENNTPITRKELQDVMDKAKGTVMICYPMGLPEHDPVRTIIENRETYDGHAVSKELLDPDTALAWFCSKHMLRTEKLSKYSGNNEKTKITVKLTKKGAAAPAKEPTVDAETQKNMMALYSKRQQELKRLEEQEEVNSNLDWANPQGLKSAFSGIGQIKWKSGGL